MAFPKIIYVIPVLVISNTIFVMLLHSTYLNAIDQLNKQRIALEDVQYHVENNPDVKHKEQMVKRLEYFANWWGGNYSTEKKHTSTELVIGIPAIPRPQLYLTTTLAAIVEQLPSTNPDLDSPWRNNSSTLMNNTIQIYVVNNKAGEVEFPEFESLRAKYTQVPELVFLDNTMKQVDRFAHMQDPDDFNNPNDIPGKKVRHQTYDLISLMKIANKKSKYFMFMEDDFPICPKALDTFYYILRKANYYQPNWKAIRSSYGMNGIFVKGNELESLASFFDTNAAHRPPDGLVVEWMCGKLSPTAESCEVPQRHLTFRWNIFKHIGAVSSLRQTGLKSFPGCWAFYSDLLWEVDGFNANDCGDDDLWPCKLRPFEDSLHRTLDIEGWPYMNGYISVTEQDGEIDVALRQRSLHLLYSGPSSATTASPPSRVFNFLVVAFSMVVWKIMLL